MIVPLNTNTPAPSPDEKFKLPPDAAIFQERVPDWSNPNLSPLVTIIPAAPVLLIFDEFLNIPFTNV